MTKLWGIIWCARVTCQLSERDVVCMTGDFTKPCFREMCVCGGKSEGEVGLRPPLFGVCAPVSYFLVRHVRAAQSESSSTAVRIRQEMIPLPSSKSVPNILLKIKCVISTPLMAPKRIATNNCFKQVFNSSEIAGPSSTVWTNTPH